MLRLRLLLAFLMVATWCSFSVDSADAQRFGCFRGNSGCRNVQRCRPMRRCRPARCCPQPRQPQCCPQPCQQSCCPQPCSGCNVPSCGCAGGVVGGVVGPIDQNRGGLVPGMGTDQTCLEEYDQCINICAQNCGGSAACNAFCTCQRNVCNQTSTETCRAPSCYGGGGGGGGGGR